MEFCPAAPGTPLALPPFARNVPAIAALSRWLAGWLWLVHLALAGITGFTALPCPWLAGWLAVNAFSPLQSSRNPQNPWYGWISAQPRRVAAGNCPSLLPLNPNLG